MHDPLEVVLRRAFDAAARQLRKLVQLQQGEVKAHVEQQATAIIHKLFPEEGYGFLRTVDTQEDIYFHRNSVLHNHFEQVAIGMGVRYEAEVGDKSLQATTVQIVNTSGTPKEPPARF
ncbi:MAG: cold shock domain-containing protein [Candidatus Methanoperedens sp.]|nr:cold shock domain-containing protein [Candidatus Methanoperedens sp.]